MRISSIHTLLTDFFYQLRKAELQYPQLFFIDCGPEHFFFALFWQKEVLGSQFPLFKCILFSTIEAAWFHFFIINVLPLYDNAVHFSYHAIVVI